MGRAEKIVVLGVLFVIVLILAVSLETGPEGDVQAAKGDLEQGPSATQPLPPPPDVERSLGAATPRAGAAQDEPLGARAPEGSLGTGDVRSAPDPISVPTPPAEGPRLLTAENTPIYAVPEDLPEDWALTTLAGLADHRFDPTLKVYRVRAGDTFESVAERYYGDARYAALLRRNNEGLTELTPTIEILVPIRDDGVVAGGGAGGGDYAPGDEYVVVDGDSLWKIAKKVWGKGHRWGEIFEANRDVLPTADDLSPGMRLRIP